MSLHSETDTHPHEACDRRCFNGDDFRFTRLMFSYCCRAKPRRLSGFFIARVPGDRSSSLGRKPGAARLLLALDGVEDPQNLGALLRVADGAGVDGVVLTERRSAPLSPVAVKASAGAAEHLRIARVVNLVRALEELKRQNLWIIGLDERGTADYDQFDLTGDCVIVLGREGAGLHDLVRRTCDHLLRIPMAGGVSSLNVSAAGAVVLYEAFRQRRNAARLSAGASSSAGPGALHVSSPASKPGKQKGLGS